jgi:GrpB-like predicted nucleotidyltransferase (UPF0157 family)
MKGFFYLAAPMKIRIEPYNPLWKDIFQKERIIVATALNEFSPVIEHIGSTSVEGLTAKPVIDMLVGLKAESDLPRGILPMQQTGFTYNTLHEHQMPYRRFFVRYTHPENHEAPLLLEKSNPNPSEAGFDNITHVHIMVYGTYHWTRHIAFRDYLRAHPQARQEYAALKLELAKQDFENSMEYSSVKNDFMQKIERESLKWLYGSKSAGAGS